MKSDYLWDRSGKPDPEVLRLERLLSGLRYDQPIPSFPEMEQDSGSRELRNRLFTVAFWLWRIPILELASLAVLILVGVWICVEREGYDVLRLAGSPEVEGTHLVSTGRLEVGQKLETDAFSRARIQVGSIGKVDIGPNSRVTLIQAQLPEHRITLERGTLQATILAPPRSFRVDTPSAQAVDLGCSYTLQVDDVGAGLLHVDSGWVAFEIQGRESFVPAGAECLTRPGSGPGTPYQEDSSPSFRAALEVVDFDPTPGPAREYALTTLISGARKEDSLTLWHLLARGDGTERARVYQRLAALSPPPPDVSMAGILKGDRKMLDLWWNDLGLGDASWWRQWEQSWQVSR